MNVSVVIPLYNKAAYIQRALNSVLGQTFQDFECIVVDDGSTDGSGDIVERIGDPRIKLVRQANGGVSQARNKGIELAHYPLVAFLDADDEWMPEFMEISLKMHLEHPAIVASFSNYQKDPDGKPAFRETTPGSRILNDYFAFCLCHNGCGMCSSAVMVRRETLLSIGGFPVGRKMGEDLDTWARLAWSSPVGYIPNVLAIYHCSDGACALSRRVSREGQCQRSYDILDTYKAWSSAGLVPKNLLQSSEAYVYHLRLLDSHEAIRRRRPDQAWLLYSGVPGRYCFSAMALSGYVALAIPYCRRPLLGLGRRFGVWRLALRWRFGQISGKARCLP